MIICICHRVSDRDIARSVREGCNSFDELQAKLAVATGCGACHDCAQASFHELRNGGLANAAQRPVHAVPVRVLRRLNSLNSLHGHNDSGLAGAAA